MNVRRKKCRDFATLAEMDMEIMEIMEIMADPTDPTDHPPQTPQICDLAAQIFLSWRRKMRGSLESQLGTGKQRLSKRDIKGYREIASACRYVERYIFHK